MWDLATVQSMVKRLNIIYTPKMCFSSYSISVQKTTYKCLIEFGKQQSFDIL